jgi:ABC-type dipeptide/oligopeptide/nickel transport system permease component
LLLDAVMKKDFNMLKGIVFLNSAFFIIINALAEIIYPKIDPRIKHG